MDRFFKVTVRFNDADNKGRLYAAFVKADTIKTAQKQVINNFRSQGSDVSLSSYEEIAEEDYYLELAIEKVNIWNDKFRENHQFYRELDSYETEDIFVLKARYDEKIHKAIESHNKTEFYKWITGQTKCPFSSQEWFDITALKMLDLSRMAEKLRTEDAKSAGSFYGD